ncbi:MAG: glycoside hydrolase [SAR324 cluster bacterium]
MVFLWHMHQPDYRDAETGEFRLPWVYLHALKDYSDMAAHLETHPRMRAVVNFVPCLLDQLDDYCRQFESGTFRDPLLALLGHPDFNTLDARQRRSILERCFLSNPATMIAPFAPYQRLYELHKRAPESSAASGFTPAMLADVIVWYHLSWMGETERRDSPIFAELSTKGQDFDAGDRLRLREFIGEVLRGILPRYRALAERGQIELSATPFSHPLAPLLISFSSARDATPAVALPNAPDYPGGAERVRAQVAQARLAHAQWFGSAPAGMWPAEGAVSESLLQLLAEAGIRWTATSASVLANSLRAGGAPAALAEDDLYHGYRVAAAPAPVVFFRNEKLSDLLGFEYRSWWASDAVGDFIGRLEAIHARIPAGQTRVVSVILDGENAWEWYPYNGFFFFRELYARLEDHAAIEPTTFSAYLAAHPDAARKLDRLAAGSWVHGNFLKWIGAPDKNRAWEQLCAAKESYDLYCAAGAPPAIERILRGCESSDWFWWFGDFDSHSGVAELDALFRHNLRALYRAVGHEPPAALDVPISRAAASPGGDGAMQRAR